MKCFLYSLSITLLVFLGCSNQTEKPKIIEPYTDETKTISEMSESLCECELCKNVYSTKNHPWYSVKTYIYNYTGWVGLPLEKWDCTIANEYLYLVEKATSFLIELDKNFDSTIAQVRHPNSKTIVSFNNLLTSINHAYVHDGNRASVYNNQIKEHFFVQLSIYCSKQDRESWVMVEFAQEDDEWVVYDIYGYAG